MSRFSDVFNLGYGKSGRYTKEIHYEETGSHKYFHRSSVEKYGTGLFEFLDLKDTLHANCCFNIMTHSIIVKDSDILDIEKIGEQMYNKFIEERSTGPNVMYGIP